MYYNKSHQADQPKITKLYPVYINHHPTSMKHYDREKNKLIVISILHTTRSSIRRPYEQLDIGQKDINMKNQNVQFLLNLGQSNQINQTNQKYNLSKRDNVV